MTYQQLRQIVEELWIAAVSLEMAHAYYLYSISDTRMLRMFIRVNPDIMCKKD